MIAIEDPIEEEYWIPGQAKRDQYNYEKLEAELRSYKSGNHNTKEPAGIT
jgi:hypothetical protein